jgi:dipeptide/tripeptide permease
MEINWKAPFELAFELGLFLVGSVFVLLVSMIAIIIAYGLLKSFITAIRSFNKTKNDSDGKFRLKPVK